MSNSRIQETAVQNEDAEGRARVYQLLAALLAAPPDESTLQSLTALAMEPVEDTPFTRGLRALAEAAARADPATLKDEYFNLFIGLGRGELLPYASWYLDGALMERILARLRHDLQRMGFERRDQVREPEDHAGAILETMGMIIADPGLSLEQAAFFDVYVGSWMERFFRDLENAQGSDFYTVVGRLGGQFISIERGFFPLPE